MKTEDHLITFLSLCLQKLLNMSPSCFYLHAIHTCKTLSRHLISIRNIRHLSLRSNYTFVQCYTFMRQSSISTLYVLTWASIIASISDSVDFSTRVHIWTHSLVNINDPTSRQAFSLFTVNRKLLLLCQIISNIPGCPKYFIINSQAPLKCVVILISLITTFSSRITAAYRFYSVGHVYAPLSNCSQAIMWVEVNETNALTMPTLITAPDRPPNRRASGHANYASTRSSGEFQFRIGEKSRSQRLKPSFVRYP